MLHELPRVLTPGSAAELGIGRARTRTEVRRGNWRIIARGGVLTRPESPRRDDWAALGIAMAGPSAALSGWDAARALGLGSAWPPTDEVLVLSRHASNRVIGQVRIRCTSRPYAVHLTSADQPDHPLTPVAHNARVIADASRYYGALAPVRAMVTGAVQRHLCTVDELLAELRTGPRNDTALFRAALADAVDGARSEAEAVAARRMISARLPAFELNVPIVGPGGALIAVVDVLWRTLRAVLEIDSREYHFGEAQWKATMARHNLLTRCGLAVTHRPPSEISQPGGRWLDEVGRWLQGRACELGVPVPGGHGALRPAAGGPAPYRLVPA